MRQIEKIATIERLTKWAKLDLIEFKTRNVYINENIYEERKSNPWKYCNKRK